MGFKVKLTKEEAEEKFRQYEELFSIVRTLDEITMDDIRAGNPPGGSNNPCPCFDFWNKREHCENCAALRAYEEKGQATKIEFQDGEAYYVIAQYVEIDGKCTILECLSKMENDALVDENGREKLLNSLFHFENILYTDALTGVFNRRYYEDKVKTLQGVTYGVAVMDIDDFKLYNDQFGHNVGDLVLRTVAKKIKNCLGKSDRLIRFGGDEFLLLTDNAKPDTLAVTMQTIQENLNEIEIPNYPKLKISVSIGGVTSREEETIESAVERADKLMYYAKNTKNSIITEDSLSFDEKGFPAVSYHDVTRNKVLVVDDSEMNRMILSEMLQDDFEILEATDGKEAMGILKEYRTGISLVLLDIEMPVMDGFQVLTEMTENHWIEDIPVIMISADATDSHISRAYAMGASDYIVRPFDSKVVSRRVMTTIKSYSKQRRLMSIVTEQIHKKERDQRMMAVILSHIVEFHNGESRLHTLHINVLTEMILKKLISKTDQYDLTLEEIQQIVTGSSLHDIGKIAIPSQILNKPGKLTAEEFNTMKTHTVVGEEMLRNIYRYKDEPLVKISREITRWHHERYDGKGYPDGLKGEEIPISAQVVSIADVYDALVSERVYKPARPQEEALTMIQNGECGQFNPILVECLLELKDAIKKKYDETIEDDYIV